MNLIFDTETTGLFIKDKNKYPCHTQLKNYDTCRIVSISWFVTQNDKIISQDYYVIKPDNFIIGEESIKIHGITQEYATENGIDIRFVMASFQTALEKCSSIVAHNIEFDIHTIKSELYRYNFQNIIDLIDSKHHVCTMAKGKEFMNSKKNPKLSELYKYIYKEDLKDAHNAIADTYHCYKCFIMMFPFDRSIFFFKDREVKLTEEQKKIVFADINKNMLVLASAGSGKCHALNTPILMYDGSIKLVQDIKIGDILMGDDSTPRNVLELGTGTDNLYDVIDQYNHKYTVNSEHILCLIDPYNGSVEIEVNNFLKLSTENQKLYKGYRTAVNFPPQLISEDPYQIGYNITSNIPNNYKINSKKIRLQVLAGIIDRYGILNDKGIIITNIDFKDDLLFLARSVGLTAYLYNITIIITGILSIIPTKIWGVESINDRFSTLTTNISILFNRRDQYYGFTLDGNHKYVLGDFTVTHNTTTSLSRIKYLLDQGIEEEAIMLTTFTRDAANDMKNKLFDILGYKAKINTGTIDSISKSYTVYKNPHHNGELTQVSEHGNNFLKLIKENNSIVNKYKYLFVDEFQDINEIQFNIIKEFYNNGVNIFCVGDDAQNLYTFRGSNIEYILNFKDYFPNNTELFQLTYNFRSTREIINFANASIEKNIHQIPKKMVPGILTNTISKKPTIKYFPTQSLQNNFILSKIEELTRDSKLDEIAILSSINQSLFHIEELLTKNNIPHVYLDGKSDIRSFIKKGHICLCTIHKSKGLEWDHVFLINASDDIFPKMKNEKTIEDDRRVFYVAATRARKELNIYYCSNPATPYVTRFVSELDKNVYNFENFRDIYIQGKSEMDYYYLETSVTKLIDNLDGTDYIYLKENGIIPIITDIPKQKLYQEFNYNNLIIKDDLYSDFGTFIDLFITREVTRVFDLVKSKRDKYALSTLANITLANLEYEIYKKYRSNFKKNLKNINSNHNEWEIQRILEKGCKSIENNHIGNLLYIIKQIFDNSIKYNIPPEKIPIFNYRFLPEDFEEKMQNHLSIYSSNTDYKSILNDIWEVSKCKKIVIEYRRRLLFNNIQGIDFYEDYKDLFENISTKFIDHIKLNKSDIECHAEYAVAEIYGELDLRIDDKIIDYKTSQNVDISLENIVQLLCYKVLCDKNNKKINKIGIFNPLKGVYYELDVSTWDKHDELFKYLINKRDTLMKRYN
jgi:DNA polymerase III epsilon subunit-like protein